MSPSHPHNKEIARILEKIADLLEVQDANPFRVGAYRDAAETVRNADQSLGEMALEEGEEALRAMPDIGEGIAGIIHEVAQSGRSDMLQRLQGEVHPGEVFTQVPGIGNELAQRIAEELDVSTLEELEQAAHDGRLEELKGFGQQKVENIQVSLAGMLSTAARRSRRQAGLAQTSENKPHVGLLLNIDRAYREKAEAGELRKIAPKRFNPEGKAWLPIMNEVKKGWDITALYSNTARAHDLEKTHDWVVIYYQKGEIESQATVVTETKGPLEGKRVVRGRESECLDYYAD